MLKFSTIIRSKQYHSNRAVCMITKIIGKLSCVSFPISQTICFFLFFQQFNLFLLFIFTIYFIYLYKWLSYFFQALTAFFL